MSESKLEFFAEAFFKASLDLANCNLTQNDFYEKVFSRVGEVMGFSRDSILHLHHAFHWTLFSPEDSPLRLHSANRQDYGRVVSGNCVNVAVLSYRVSRRYGVYLDERMKSILEGKASRTLRDGSTETINLHTNQFS